MTLAFAPLHPVFAARADGIDLCGRIGDAVIGEIEAAMGCYAVLVFRDQQLSQDEDGVWALHAK